MESSDHSKPSIRKLDSAVVLERLDSSTSSHCAVFLRQATSTDEPSKGDAERGEATATPVALELSVRFGRVIALMVLVVSVLVALTITFNKGVIIGDFDLAKKDADAQKKLLDDYNSYTGNVASLFSWPIEKIVALAVQVMMLRVLSASLLRAEINWKTDTMTLAVGASVGYLISNGFNALNVQPQPPTIEAVISAEDLTFAADFGFSDAAARSSNLTRTFSERSPRNPITNTVLRNLLLPRVPTAQPYCDLLNSYDTMGSRLLPDLVLDYGFTQRDWHSRVLQEALEPKQLRVVVNPTNKTASQVVDVNDLPMNASTAADLFKYGVFVLKGYFPWKHPQRPADLTSLSASEQRYWDQSINSVERDTGLLPPTTPALTETARREWFLRESVTALARQLNSSVNASRSDVVMEFSHVDISPTIRFDALTFEIEVDPTVVAEASSNKTATRYNNIFSYDGCGPQWPARCMMTKPLFTTDPSMYDPPPQVQVFGACVNTEGLEELRANTDPKHADIVWGMDCLRLSNTTLMVMSVGKRFVADEMLQLKFGNASGLFDSSGYIAVKNLRRIFSVTMAKLSWQLSNLTTEFNATCATDAGSCQGLRFPLSAPPAATNQSQRQELVVGEAALPLNLVPRPILDNMYPRFLPIVRLHEPSSLKRDMFYDPFAGDALLPHNIGTIRWGTAQPLPDPYQCNAYIEERLQLIFNNHMYIEHGLQTAYTAATFFLLQNAVVKDVIALNATVNSLNFHGNRQRVTLLASIPDQNAWLTLAGCAVLVMGLGSVLVWAWATPNTKAGNSVGGLGHVTTPHVIARVMLDSTHFPPLFLYRYVVGTGGDTEGPGESGVGETKPVPPTVEGFVIDALSLQAVKAEAQEAQEAQEAKETKH